MKARRFATTVNATTRRKLHALVPLSLFVTLPFACSEAADSTLADANPRSPELEGGPSPASDADADTDVADAAVEPSWPDDTVTCRVTPCATQLVAGSDHFCALLQDKTVRCWGNDLDGALGLGAPDEDAAAPQEAPVPRMGPGAVDGLADVVSLSSAGTTTCALLVDGTVRCWGGNASGQLGLSATEGIFDDAPHPVPTAVALDGPATRVDVGLGASCALAADGKLRCWGRNDVGQLSRASTEPVSGPVTIAWNEGPITRTAGSTRTTYALAADGNLFAWGGLVGRAGSLDPDRDPAPLPALSAVSSVAVGYLHSCAIANGEVHCWSTGVEPPLCNMSLKESPLPARVEVASDTRARVRQMALSAEVTCIRWSDGALDCCGDATYGQLGDDLDGGLLYETAGFKRYVTFLRLRSPSETSKRYVSIAASDKSICALHADGSVTCWGGNDRGQLGQRTHDEDAHVDAVRVTL